MSMWITKGAVLIRGRRLFEARGLLKEIRYVLIMCRRFEPPFLKIPLNYQSPQNLTPAKYGIHIKKSQGRVISSVNKEEGSHFDTAQLLFKIILDKTETPPSDVFRSEKFYKLY